MTPTLPDDLNQRTGRDYVSKPEALGDHAKRVLRHLLAGGDVYATEDVNNPRAVLRPRDGDAEVSQTLGVVVRLLRRAGWLRYAPQALPGGGYWHLTDSARVVLKLAKW